MKPPPLALLSSSEHSGPAAPHDPRASQQAEGPSFPLAAKVLASAVMLGLIVMAAGFVRQQALAAGPGPTLVPWGFLATVGLVIGSGYWGVLTSRTRIDPTTIEQSWLWNKRVALKDITQVKLVRVPGLDALVVPRLVVRTGWGLTTFQTGDPDVLALFRRLVHGAVV